MNIIHICVLLQNSWKETGRELDVRVERSRKKTAPSGGRIVLTSIPTWGTHEVWGQRLFYRLRIDLYVPNVKEHKWAFSPQKQWETFVLHKHMNDSKIRTDVWETDEYDRALIVLSCKVVFILTREHGLLLKHLSLRVLKRRQSVYAGWKCF